MGLTVFNTLGNRKETFVPITPGKVKVYVCGVTVYDLCHIGHARANIVFDLIVRYLRYRGYEVTFVRNFTDIDDKIIDRANRENTDYLAISNRYIEAFYMDFGRMGLLRPDAEPRATEHIPEIIALVARLLEGGKAYVAGGDVYYSVRGFREYGKLSGKNTEELLSGARVEVDERKRDPLDFVLWKASKPGEPAWKSPWGPGRPGWHIECSAMAMKHLGETFDIHGGGKDLVFPHHENEIAQSESATGKPFARYWIHNGFVNVDSEKMSKSLGNVFTLRDVLDRVKPDVLRFFFASSHYRSPIDYSDRSLAEAKAGLDRLYRVKEKAETCASAGWEPSSVPGGEEFAPLRDAPSRFLEAMDDDFNTAAALGRLFDAVRALNRLAPADPGSEPEKAGQFLAGYKILEPLFGVLGLLRTSAEEYFRGEVSEIEFGAVSEGLPRSAISQGEIERRIEERKAARARKDFAEADRIRAELDAMGVLLEDTKAGTTWKYKNP
ncbi:MAG TPA: cysteine--tRNA ligase [Candidatus Deferrimicrobiaceae bacterium]|nr:cysteine--tRNA ligase [Candidatus Deferrimicrobiaceae bacterium]